MLFNRRFSAVDITMEKPSVMGVLNITPDSFSDGGQYYQPNDKQNTAALARASQMVDEGATFIDVGGESTRPGASAVSLQQELDRVIPVIEKIASNLDCIISVDTSSPQVMSAAADAGAGLLNDVRAFTREGALDVAAATGLPLCLMHMRGEPVSMQDQPSYQSVVDEVRDFLLARVTSCKKLGISKDRLIVDPGFGFGKTLTHNLQLLKSLAELRLSDLPMLVGMSRKSMIGEMLNKPANERLFGGIALAALAVSQGASIIRTHDVAPTCDAVNVAYALRVINE